LRDCSACPQLKIKERREKLLKNLNVIPVLTRWILSDECNEVHYIGGPDVLPAPLEGEEEAKQLQKLINENDESARRMLIEHNLRLVVYIAKKFDNTGVGVEDLISIGTIGLIKGINTFKTDKNIKLATYASRCIENEILMYLRRNNKTKLEVSIDEPLNVDWDGNELLLSDILGTDDDVISRGLENEVEKSLLKKAIEKLNKREKSIVEMRFGLNNKEGEEMTQKEVADFLGISQSYISRLEKKIMNRLKKEIVKYE
jgi:RNA polymerase sporulation-specific sigma factor